jgi:hypothetical protein
VSIDDKQKTKTQPPKFSKTNLFIKKNKMFVTGLIVSGVACLTKGLMNEKKEKRLVQQLIATSRNCYDESISGRYMIKHELKPNQQFRVVELEQFVTEYKAPVYINVNSGVGIPVGGSVSSKKQRIATFFQQTGIDEFCWNNDARNCMSFNHPYYRICMSHYEAVKYISEKYGKDIRKYAVSSPNVVVSESSDMEHVMLYGKNENGKFLVEAFSDNRYIMGQHVLGVCVFPYFIIGSILTLFGLVQVLIALHF